MRLEFRKHRIVIGQYWVKSDLSSSLCIRSVERAPINTVVMSIERGHSGDVIRLEDLETGDLVFHQPSLCVSMFSQLVSGLSLSTVTHVGVVVVHPPGFEESEERFLWHSMQAPLHCHALFPASQGVHIESLQMILSSKEWTGKWWCRPFRRGSINRKLSEYGRMVGGRSPMPPSPFLPPCTASNPEVKIRHCAVRHLIRKYSNTKYPIKPMNWLRSIMLLPWGDPHMYHCSSFVVDLFETIGVIQPIHTTIRNSVTPAALANDDGCLTCINWSEDCRPWDRMLVVES